MLPLKGITVVSVEQAVAAPFATRQLADLGARVIKIERPDGGDFARGYDTTVNGLSSYFVWLNRSKESLTLDLKRPDGRRRSRRACSSAPTSSCRISRRAPPIGSGIGRGGFARAHPRLIVCNVSGYGVVRARIAAKKAYDLLVQSEVGLLSITGHRRRTGKGRASRSPTSPPACTPTPGILTALFARGNDRPRHVDRRLAVRRARRVDGTRRRYFAAYGGTPPPRSGAHHASIAPYGPFRAGDGGQVYLGIQNAREWTRFCADVLERPELGDDARFSTNPLRVRHRQALHDVDRVGVRRADRRPRSSRGSSRRADRVGAHELGAEDS